jgi:hypothetical protein
MFFGGLADWNALRGDLPAAVRRSLSLLEVNRFDESDQTDVVTRDLVVAAPTLIEAGELSLTRTMRNARGQAVCQHHQSGGRRASDEGQPAPATGSGILQALETRWPKTEESGVFGAWGKPRGKSVGSASLACWELPPGFL